MDSESESGEEVASLFSNDTDDEDTTESGENRNIGVSDDGSVGRSNSEEFAQEDIADNDHDGGDGDGDVVDEPLPCALVKGTDSEDKNHCRDEEQNHQLMVGSELQLYNEPLPGTSRGITPIDGTVSSGTKQITTSISGRPVQDILHLVSSSTQSGWDTAADTRSGREVHVHLTKTEIKSTAVGIGGEVIVKPESQKKQKPNTEPSRPTLVQSIRQETENRIEKWTQGMVQTAGTQLVIDKVQQRKTWLVVTGSPGEGKTTAAYLALKELHGVGRQVYEVTSPEQYFKVKKTKGPIIMLNDILGASQFNIANLEMWRAVLADIFALKEHKGLEALRQLDRDMLSQKFPICVIFVIRTSVLNTATDHLERFKDLFLDNESLVDLTHDVKSSPEERFDIWRYHAEMYKVYIEESIVKDVMHMSLSHGFPHCCKLFASIYSKNNTLSMKSFFSKPLEFLNQEMTSLLKESTTGLLLREMLKHDGCLELESVTDDERRYQFKIVVESLSGTYLSEEKGCVKFSHPSIYDSAVFLVCKKDLHL